MRRMKLSPVLLLGLLAGCTPTYHFSAAGPTVPAAKPADCEIAVLTAPPTQRYREIGTFEADAENRGAASASQLRDIIRAKACSVGADAVLVLTAASYERATAIVWVTEPAEPTPADPMAPTAPAPAPAPAESAPADPAAGSTP